MHAAEQTECFLVGVPFGSQFLQYWERRGASAAPRQRKRQQLPEADVPGMGHERLCQRVVGEDGRASGQERLPLFPPLFLSLHCD